MPTYSYECGDCHYTFNIMQSMLDKKLRKCPKCSKFKLHRLIGTGAGIIFKGSGFYETDYKKKDEKKAVEAKAPSCAKSENPACANCPKSED